MHMVYIIYIDANCTLYKFTYIQVRQTYLHFVTLFCYTHEACIWLDT